MIRQFKSVRVMTIMTSVLCLIAVLPFLGLVTGFISPPPPLASSPTQSALCWRSSATFNSVVSSLSSSSRMDELDADAVDMTKEEVEMGDHTEPIYVPKDGENDYGGGSKFKRLMEQAQQRSRSSTSSTTIPAATTTTGTTTAAGGGGPPSTAASPDAPLPSGWESTLDPSSGQTYYYNSNTQATSWTRPVSSPQEQQKEVVAVTAAPATPVTEPSSSVENTNTENTNDAMGLRMALRSSQLQVQELTTDLADAQSRILTMQELITRLDDDTKIFKTEILKLRERDDTTTISNNENDDTTNDKVAGRSSAGTGTPTPTEETKKSSELNEETTVAATAIAIETTTKAPKLDMTQQETETLHAAVLAMDVSAVTAMVDTQGMVLDVNTTEAAFWAVVNAIDTAEHNDQALTGDISTMIHHIFDADFQHLLEREQIRTNITCMQPTESGLTTHGMNYIFDDNSHKDLPLTEGRRCEDGHCCEECSRNVFPTFALEPESSLETFPELASLTFNELTNVRSSTILNFMRLIERVRRTIAHEYGLPLKTILPLQAYSRKYVAGTTQQGGGGGEGDFVILHTDESTHAGYHYSCVLYLSTKGKDFDGGDFVFNDPDPDAKPYNSDDEDEDEQELLGESLAEQIRKVGRKFTPFAPTRGSAVIFSSGWENMHEVDKITSGTRYVVPCFFTTCPVPDQAYDQMVVGKPQTDDAIADDWLHLLLAHRDEIPVESLGRVKELLMKWHYLCTPLSEH